MARKQSVLKLAREKKKESERDSKTRVIGVEVSERNQLKNIMKKAGHNTKQIDEIIAGMNDSEISTALKNYNGSR